jgi:hypothetical protein
MIQHELKHLDQKPPTDPYGDKMLGSALLPKKLRIISMHTRYGTQESQRFKIEIIQY